MPKKRLSIAIPASIASDTPHLREKTSKIGLIARAAVIFRVDEIAIYFDKPKADQTEDVNLIETVLSYVETPQYLRKRTFKLTPSLQYAGVLPPLRTPHHPLNRKMKDLKVGEFREGVTLSNAREGALVDIGVEQPALVPNKHLPVGERTTVRIMKVAQRVEAKAANRDDAVEYWGYTLSRERKSLKDLLGKRDFDLTIATSRHGTCLMDIAKKICDRWRAAGKILILFGAPSWGLYEIARSEGFKLDDYVDFVVNTIPFQGTETVRTEEALIASLATLVNLTELKR